MSISLKETYPRLVGDIGGTNARFAGDADLRTAGAAKQRFFRAC
jgi:glucokinase